jgi:hypothetical protein
VLSAAGLAGRDRKEGDRDRPEPTAIGEPAVLVAVSMGGMVLQPELTT